MTERRDDYLAEIQAWQQQRHAELTRPDGWLTLAGLFWLEAGENHVGADRNSAVPLPARKAPADLGTLTIEDGRAYFDVAPGADVRHEGEAVTHVQMQSDRDEAPTVLTHGTLSWFVIRRGDRWGVRLRDSAHPHRARFAGVECFPIDPAWRVDAVLEPFEAPRTILVPTVLGTATPMTAPGSLRFRVDHEDHRLIALDKAGGSLWLIFTDATSGTQTYGGGRFLTVPAVDASGCTVIDFNKAYNPPCAFTPYATCPRPPQGNRLPIAVTAGEKRYTAPEAVAAL